MKSVTAWVLYILLIKSVFSFHKTINHKTYKINFKKCCPLNEGLLTEKVNNSIIYSCSDQFEDAVLPLQLNKINVDVGIPEDCSSTEFCVDKTVDNSLVKLLCDSKANIVSSEFTTINKCCPNGMYYNNKLKSCSYHDFWNDTRIEDEEAVVYDMQIGQPVCNNALVDYLIVGDTQIRNGILSMKDNTTWVTNDHEILAKGSFCVDKINTDTVVRVCEDARKICSYMPCLPKCCTHGKIYLLKNGAPACLPVWNETYAITTTMESGNVTVDLEGDFAVMPPISCKYGRYVVSMKNRHFYPDGKLKIGDAIYGALDNKYCVENAKVGGYNGMFTFACYPSPIRGQNAYYFVGAIISCVFLTATLIVYIALPDLRNLHGKTVMCYVASLLAFFVCLSITRLRGTKYSKTNCLVIGYCMMFAFISAFAWLNVMCFDIWWTFGGINVSGTKKKSERKTFSLHCLYAFGISFLLTSLALFGMFYDGIPQEYKPSIGHYSCYFHVPDILVYTIYVMGPVIIINISNIVFFVLTTKNCLKVKMNIARLRDIDSPRKQCFLADKATLLMNLKLFILMGISWIIEILGSYIAEPEILWTILDTVNIFQGLWIFCIFVLKEKVWKALKHRVGYRIVKDASQTQTTTVSSKNSYASLANYRTNSVNNSDDPSVLQNILNETKSPTHKKNII